MQNRAVDLPWMDKCAPGAARAARYLIGDNLTDQLHERLWRLTGHPEHVADNQAAWKQINKWCARKWPSEVEIHIAQYELFRAALRAPDLPDTSKIECKSYLRAITASLNKTADELQNLTEIDPQISAILQDSWRLHQIRSSTGPLDAMSENQLDFRNDCHQIADLLRKRASFLDRAAAEINRIGPESHRSGKPESEDAQTTKVIHHIAEACRRACDKELYGTVARLTNASLDLTGDDAVNEQTVRRSLHPGR